MRLGALVAVIGALMAFGTVSMMERFEGAGTEPTPTPSPTPTPTPTTAPLPGVFRFAVIGDSGTGEAAQQAVADRMCRFRKRHPFKIVVTTGDNVYPDGDPDRFEAAFREPFKCLLDQGVRFRSSLGNHDVMTNRGRPQLKDPSFGYRGRNYVLRRGGVRFVIADSNALDRDWLDDALDPAPGDRWTVVVFHHPVYSPGLGHGSTPGFSDLPEMFRRHGVDLALAGHDHIYAVTRSLKGIRYIVTGGGGAPLYGCGEAWFSARCESRHHFLWVRASGDQIVVEAVPVTGEPFDRVKTKGSEAVGRG